MPATPERAAFVAEQFRSATWESQQVKDLYGRVARDTKDDPYESFFDDPLDAQKMLNERGLLIGSHARRFRTTIGKVLLESDIDLSEAVPSATVIDDNLVANMTAAIVAVESIDLADEKTVLNLWGVIGAAPYSIAEAVGQAAGSGRTTGSIVIPREGAGSAGGAGNAGATGTSQMVSQGAGSSAGAGAAAGDGASIGVQAGTGAAAGVGVSAAAGVDGSSAGAGDAGGVGGASGGGASIASAAGAASGSGGETGTGGATVGAAGAAAGTGAGSAAGQNGAAATGAHRAWRLYCREGGGSGLLNAAEIQMRTTSGGADVSSSANVIFSSQRSGEEASKAFDDNTSTYWQSNGTFGHWIGQDFGAGNEKAIVEITMQTLSGFSARAMREFDVQYSDDWNGTIGTWTTAWSVSFTAWTNAQQTFTKPGAVNSQYWRIRPDTIDSGGQVMGAAEVEMRSTLGGVDQTGSGTAISRTFFSGFPASNAFDNSTSTEWSGANAVAGIVQSDWLGYNFGAGVTKDIRQISYMARANATLHQSPVSGWIESSTDGVNWLSRWTFAGLTWSGGATNVFAAP